MFRNLMLAAVAVLALAPAAWAGHDRYVPAPAVAGIAHELEFAARHVHRTAERFFHPHDPYAYEALASLHRLENRARHFHRKVERGSHPRHLHKDFVKLLDAYHAAAYDVGHLRSRHLRRDFRHVDRLVFRLEATLGFRRGHGPRFHERPRHRRTHGAIVFGDDRGRTRYRVHIGW